MIRRIICVLVICSMALTLILSGCSRQSEEDNGKMKIVTTLFPQFDFARQIAGEMAEVTLLLPPGVEAHSYEPTPSDIIGLSNADVFIYTGEFMEPWAHRVIDSIKNDNIIIISAGDGIDLIEGGCDHTHGHTHEDHTHGHSDEDHTHGHTHEDHTHGHSDEDHTHGHTHEDHTHGHSDEDHTHGHSDEDHTHGHSDEDHTHGHTHEDHTHGHHHHGDNDPHIWVDPLLAVQMMENILEGIILADPENEDYYTDNARELEEEIMKLHDAFLDLAENASTNTIIHAGHFAFGYFARRYGFEYISPYEGFSPNSEPTTQRIRDLIDRLTESDTNVVYYEELIEPRVANVISDQTGAQMLMLHAAHNVSRQELDDGVTYVEIMYNNLENLKIGLGYE